MQIRQERREPIDLEFPLTSVDEKQMVRLADAFQAVVNHLLQEKADEVYVRWVNIPAADNLNGEKSFLRIVAERGPMKELDFTTPASSSAEIAPDRPASAYQ